MRFCNPGDKRSELPFSPWRLRRRLHCIVATMALAGCSTMAAYQASDYDSGTTPAEKMTKDSDSCGKQADANAKEYGMGPYDPTHAAYNRMFDACMRAGGYQRKKP